MIEALLNHESVQEFGAYCLRLFVAVLLGGILGTERQLRGRWAGIRTHMMVSLGASIFALAALKVAPNDSNEVTRVIQGIAAGIGFLGAGTIVKLDNDAEIQGLTTASSIWMAAALGTVSGMGEFPLAAASGLISVIVLVLLRPFTKAISIKQGETAEETPSNHNDLPPENSDR